MFGFVWFNPVMLLLTAYFEIHISNVIQTVSDLILEAKWPFSNKPKPFSVSGRVDHFIYTIYHCNIELYFLRSFHYCKPHNWFKVLCATWLLLFRPLHKSREKSCLTSSYCYLLLIRFRLFFYKCLVETKPWENSINVSITSICPVLAYYSLMMAEKRQSESVF